MTTLLSISGYRYYLLVRVLMSLVATSLSISIGWHIYQLTGNAFDLAKVAMVQVLPTWLLFIVSGWVVDQISRARIIQLCMLIYVVVITALALEMSAEHFSVNKVLLLLFLFGCGRAFYFPAMQSILPTLVEKSLLTKAVSQSSTVWTIAMTTGPIVGGLVLEAFDKGVYWVLVALLCLSFLASLRLPNLMVKNRGGRSFSDLTLGIRFVWRDALVLPSISLDLFIIMFASVMALLPIYAADILHLGPDGLGLLRAMPALGSVVSGIVIGRIGYGKHAGNALFIALTGFATSVLVFSLSTTLWLSLLALFCYGFADMVSVVIRSSITHLATPDHLRGRVNAVNSLFIVSSNELGDFRAGLVAGFVGVVHAATLGALCAFGVVAMGYWRSKALRGLQKVEDIESPQE